MFGWAPLSPTMVEMERERERGRKNKSCNGCCYIGTTVRGRGKVDISRYPKMTPPFPTLRTHKKERRKKQKKEERSGPYVQWHFLRNRKLTNMTQTENVDRPQLDLMSPKNPDIRVIKEEIRPKAMDLQLSSSPDESLGLLLYSILYYGDSFTCPKLTNLLVINYSR